jgi:hypothetical protein
MDHVTLKLNNGVCTAAVFLYIEEAVDRSSNIGLLYKLQELTVCMSLKKLEECRLLGYENPVRTSQETHYVSATEPSWLMLCKIRGFHSGDYEECRLL